MRKKDVKRIDLELIEDNMQGFTQQNEFKKDIFEVYVSNFYRTKRSI